MQRFACLVGVLFLLSLPGCSPRTAVPPPASPEPPSASPAFDRTRATHLLARFSFGPAPGDVDRALRLGADGWLEQQLHPAAIPDPAGEAALAPYRKILSPPLQLLDLYQKNYAVEADSANTDDPRTLRQRFRNINARRLLGTLEMAELSRDIASSRQLQQVMVDFWANHFNVFARKGAVKLFAADYVEHVIRPHALGRFEDLLVASARHPAMLLYLDNARSTAPAPEDRTPRRRRRGINENYARELMELHTLGVNGGYTQADVVAVAHILTGWSIERPRSGKTGFRFRPELHDFSAKVALGQKFPAGHGEDEGLRLLHMLAESPATAHHIASELCERFVTDKPPGSCVDAVRDTYLRTHGSIADMLRTIVHLPAFWAARDKKVKSPLEFVASSVRALGGTTDGTLGLARVMVMLGEPIMMQPVPTGYGSRASDWMSSGALLARMKFATALAVGRAPGVSTRLDQLLLPAPDVATLVGHVNRLVLGGHGSAHTLDAIKGQVATVRDPERARELAVALALASPDFQRL